VVEDTSICKCDGFTSVSCDSSTRYRDWKASFASGRKTLFSLSADLRVDGANNIYFGLGSAAYYMGDRNSESGPSCRAYKAIKQGNGWGVPTIYWDELYDTYGIKVISYEFSQPIANTSK
jgi:hypothetical protein